MSDLVHIDSNQASAPRSQSSVENASHTPTPWFVSGVRFRMNGGEWQSINRYDESKKQDENIACVGYDSRTGIGFADAAFIVKAANNHESLLAALKSIAEWRKVNLTAEYEHGLRDIIRAITDCAAAAIDKANL